MKSKMKKASLATRDVPYVCGVITVNYIPAQRVYEVLDGNHRTEAMRQFLKEHPGD